MEINKKLFLLDAYALIFRAYYAFINRPMRNLKGLNTSAIFGFVNALDEVIRKEKPTHLAVAFDTPTPTFRHILYKEYKANRNETPDDIKLSVPYIKKILNAQEITIIEVPGFEADDVIGTLAKKAKKKGFEVYMMTPDKDFAQLVEEGIYMYKPRKSGNDIEIWGEKEVKKYFEIVEPIQVTDILALWGDASDNIPGAPGIGEKTAKKLIGEFGSIEKLFDNTSQLKGKQKESIEQFKEQIILSKQLATIDTDVPMELNMEMLSLKQPNPESVKHIFKELDFRNFLKRIDNETSTQTSAIQGSLFEIDQAINPLMENESFSQEDVIYTLVDNESKLLQLIQELENSTAICFDTETTGLNIFSAEIIGISFSIKEKTAWYIPFKKQFFDTTNTLSKLIKILKNENIIKIGHNIKYDIQILHRYGVFVKGPFFDTMIASYLLDPEARHKLDDVSLKLLSYKKIAIEELIGEKGKDQKNMRDVSDEIVKNYSCEDADITFRLYKIQKQLLKNENLDKLASEIEMPLIEVLCNIELEGFKIDVSNLYEYEKILRKEISEVEHEIYSLVGEKFNIASPKQMGIILFDKLKIPSVARKTKSKQYSTNEETLSKIKDKHPVIEQILLFRTLTKLQSTYVTVLPKLIEKSTGRIHTSFNQTIASTGRLSSLNPNLQNIPIRDNRGREIRKAFIPSDKNLILSADYSQIELRLMANMSKDPNMIAAFKNHEDIHKATAAKIFKVELDQVSREMRTKAKTANFGIIYGISAYGLSQRLKIPHSEAKQLIDNYFNTFPKVKGYIDRCISEAKEKGFVETLYNRKRILPDINSSNSFVRGIAERNAINSPLQGSAADIIKIAMVRIFNKIHYTLKSKMILQVHDELVFDVVKSELEELKAIVISEMTDFKNLSVPLIVEIGVGGNWLEAHE